MPTFQELITKKGITRTKLAHELGCSASSICAWARKTPPSKFYREKIVEYFGVDGIVFGAEESSPPEQGTQPAVRSTIDALMNERGISSRTLAGALGVSVSAVRGWRKLRSPSKLYREKIERYFGVSDIVFAGESPTIVLTREQSKMTLEALMKEKSITTMDLAVAMGVSPSAIYAWKKFRVPSKLRLRKIEQYFGVRGIIFGGQQPALPDSNHRFTVDAPQQGCTISVSEEQLLIQMIRRIGISFEEALNLLLR